MLYNGIVWSILPLMKTVEISAKAGSRANRIKIVSRIFRKVVALGAIILLLISLWAWMDSVMALRGCHIVAGKCMTATLTFSSHQIYHFPYAMTLPVLLLGVTGICLDGLGMIFLYRLLGLYEHGSYFAADNVRYIKLLGLVVIGDGLGQAILELLALPEGDIYLDKFLVGGVIILIAWVMDEARKIQEEQNLTV
jgi:hypothetical protein